MAVIGGVLFRGHDVDSYESSANDWVQRDLDAKSEDEVISTLPDQYVSYILSKCPQGLIVDFENPEDIVEGVKVPRQRDMYFGSDIGGNAEGIRFAKKIRFKGPKSAFDLKPSTATMNLARGVVLDGYVIVGIDLPASDTSYKDQYVNDQVNYLKEQVGNLNINIERLHLRIGEFARGALARKIEHVKRIKSLRESKA